MNCSISVPQLNEGINTSGDFFEEIQTIADELLEKLTQHWQSEKKKGQTTPVSFRKLAQALQIFCGGEVRLKGEIYCPVTVTEVKNLAELDRGAILTYLLSRASEPFKNHHEIDPKAAEEAIGISVWTLRRSAAALTDSQLPGSFKVKSARTSAPKSKPKKSASMHQTEKNSTQNSADTHPFISQKSASMHQAEVQPCTIGEPEALALRRPSSPQKTNLLSIDRDQEKTTNTPVVVDFEDEEVKPEKPGKIILPSQISLPAELNESTKQRIAALEFSLKHANTGRHRIRVLRMGGRTD